MLVEGKTVDLGARAFDLLLCLIEHRHRTVTKAELFDQVWPGLIVEENNLTVQVSILRKLLGQGVISTIPSQGYRFSAVVAERAVSGPGTKDVSTAAHEEPSIAVLPFRVLSNDSRAGFFADGLAEDVIALLARVPGFFLISRGSSFEFKGGAGNLSEIGTQLGVRYVVEGSVRFIADKVLVSTQLTETETGHMLWSGRFESGQERIDDLQEGITRGIISELEPELTRAEIALIRRQRPENIDAWGHYRQAIGAIALKGWRDDAVNEALSQLQQAVAIDPDFGLAHAHASLLTALSFSTGLILDSPELKQGAVDAAEHAIALDEGSSTVLGYVGCALVDLDYFERGMEILHQALEIDPSNAQAHVALGASLAMSKQYVKGIDKMRFGMRLSPKDRRLGFWGWALGVFLLAANRTEEALLEARAANVRDQKLHLSRILEAAALQRLGRSDEARAALVRARQLREKLTLAEVTRSHGSNIVETISPLWR